MWSLYRSSPLRSTLNTGYITGSGMCGSMYRSSPLRSTCGGGTDGLHYRLGACVVSMYRSSPFRSTLNTGDITGLGMCEVCTEAVDCVALWTGNTVTLQVWACVKYVPKLSVASHFENDVIQKTKNAKTPRRFWARLAKKHVLLMLFFLRC